jgi:hypothetical protein
MNNLDLLLKQLHETPEAVTFDNVIDVIDNYYHYTPTRFTNGPTDGVSAECVTNNAGENEGSCKIFSFARLHQLDETQTLHCFGRYYRDDVIENPEKDDHANIRLFMKHGWRHINFEREALTT